jgi:hypothetical protein
MVVWVSKLVLVIEPQVIAQFGNYRRVVFHGRLILAKSHEKTWQIKTGANESSGINLYLILVSGS